MIQHSLQDGKLSFRVQVVPRASRTEVVGEYNGAFRVRLAAPPVDGAANDALVRLLAKTFKVSRAAVTILSGHSSRLKQVSIEGVTQQRVAEIFGET